MREFTAISYTKQNEKFQLSQQNIQQFNLLIIIIVSFCLPKNLSRTIHEKKEVPWKKNNLKEWTLHYKNKYDV